MLINNEVIENRSYIEGFDESLFTLVNTVEAMNSHVT